MPEDVIPQEEEDELAIIKADGGLTFHFSFGYEDFKKFEEMQRDPQGAVGIDTIVIESLVLDIHNVHLAVSKKKGDPAVHERLEGLRKASLSLNIPGLLWGIPDGMVLARTNKLIKFTVQAASGDPLSPLSEGLKARWTEFALELNARNLRLGYEQPVGVPLVETIPEATPSVRKRTGKRLQIKAAEDFRSPMAATAKDAFDLFQRSDWWKTVEGGVAIYAKRNDTELRINCDLTIGFGPERAINQIMQQGPAVAQTFLAMAGLWAKENPDKPRDAYFEASATDLLRYMGRKDKGNGGYPAEDIMAQGRHIYFLSRVSVPKATRLEFRNKKRFTETISIGNLFNVDEIEVQRTLDLEEGELQSVLTFRYHMGKEMYEWLCGDHPQYAILSGKLLSYHPQRQKYHIQLGFCLAYYDKVNRQSKQNKTREINLASLLDLAAISLPKSNIDRFFNSIESALAGLAQEGVIPGVTLEKPKDIAKLSSREVLTQSKVRFPALIAKSLPQQPALSA